MNQISKIIILELLYTVFKYIPREVQHVLTVYPNVLTAFIGLYLTEELSP